jgi:chromosome segregation ATPase
MKKFQENLLVVVALSLCGLCVYQWRGQTIQRNDIERLNHVVYEKSEAIQNYTNSIRTMDQQIASMGAEMAELRSNLKSNELLLASQKTQINNLQTTAGTLTNEVAQYKKAVGTLEAKLKDAYDGIKKQNEAMQELTAQRDEFVKKYNDGIKERNDIVAKYNDLASQVEKLQGGKK